MSDLSTSFFIARKLITRGNKSTLILLIAVLCLSFFEMMIIGGIISGMYDEMIRSAKNYLSSDVIITPQEFPDRKQFIPDQDKVRAQIGTIPGIVATARHYAMAGSLSFDPEKNGKFKNVATVITGIDPEEEKRVLIVTSKLLREGKDLAANDTDQILIGTAMAGGYGAKIADDLGGARVGDKIWVTYSNGMRRQYTIKGIYDDPMRLSQVFITAKEAESILSTYNSASQILVKTDLSNTPLETYTARIQAMFPNLKVRDYNILLGTMDTMLTAINLISTILSVISILVAAIVIFVIIYVNALNKRRQIGILKAIGIKQKIIIDAYIIQALFYTLVGVGFGLILVFGVTIPLLNVHPIPLVVNIVNLTLSYTSSQVIISALSFIAAGYFAGRLPAWLVARQDILKAIWG